MEKYSFKPRYVRKVLHMMVAGIMYIIWLVGLLEAFAHSLVLHALLMNSLGIFIGPIMSFIFKKEVNGVKMISVILGAIGVFLMLRSSYKGECHLSDGVEGSYKFDLLNIASSIAGYIYFNRIEVLCKSIPRFTLMTITTAFSLVFSFIFLALTSPLDGINHFTMNIETGVFGWISNIPTTLQCILVIGIIGTLLGNFGYLYCLKFYSTKAVSNTLFIESLMGQYIAVYFIQINQSPPLNSLIGGLIVIFAMYICREACLGKFDPEPIRKIRVSVKETELEEPPIKNFVNQISL